MGINEGGRRAGRGEKRERERMETRCCFCFHLFVLFSGARGGVRRRKDEEASSRRKERRDRGAGAIVRKEGREVGGSR